ncbi:MAG: hypothetical protein N3E40_00895, partial [Dehalococcoidia bacterium]|nr:hypothetical protein [Dehalococcoidia bacterium]
TALPWLIIDHSGLWRSMTYHLDRGLHSESSYGTALLLAQVFGWTRVEGSLTFGSWNLTSPLADTIGALSPYFTLVLLVAVYSFYTWWAIKVVRLEGGNGVWNEDGAIRLLLQFAPLVLLVFLLVNKVFSAQYLIWVCPLLPLVEGWSKKPILALFIVAASLTQFVFPYNYIDFELVRPLPVAMLAVRNLLLLVAVSVLVCSILKWRGTPVFR